VAAQRGEVQPKVQCTPRQNTRDRRTLMIPLPLSLLLALPAALIDLVTVLGGDNTAPPLLLVAVVVVVVVVPAKTVDSL
jgi:hypothetical protein